MDGLMMMELMDGGVGGDWSSDGAGNWNLL
jgi:hypothetical protein